MKNILNSLFFVFLLLLLGAACLLRESDASADLKLWLLVLCATACVLNAVLGLARCLTQRTGLGLLLWALLYLLLGSSVWAALLPSEEDAASRSAYAEKYRLWQQGKVDAFAEDESGESLLLLAARLSKRGLLGQLMEQGGSPEVWAAAAMAAAESADVRTLELLLPRSGGLNTPLDGRTLLQAAVLAERPKNVEFLLAKGADINAEDAEGNSALIHAALNGNADMVKILLQHGAQPDIRNADGRDAASYARSEKIRNLLEQGDER